ncbi:TetR/AcrR family transcriptional regulator [Nocardia uniformis]|uniref:TetR/AcrR family transcriptional regulator n=1 Tax=Nocardia uniformis TaxID=53432 RepID=A0A849CIL9_9NOCA|nr:TetR/AcrR family transcriptional regulator [Nocardia uniformis]NNH73811.1 TetR/AcrR family transcriptional regulator [Nocardia uniformis]
MEVVTTDTKQRIQAVARELFAQKGVTNTSLQDIADRLSITKPALYYHFSSREELVRSIVEPLLADGEAGVEELEQTPDVQVRTAFEVFFDFHFRHRDVVRFLLVEPAALAELGLLDRVFDWRERLATILHGPDPTVAQQIRAAVALGGLADATVLFPDVPEAQLREVAVEAALGALSSAQTPGSGRRTRRRS